VVLLGALTANCEPTVNRELCETIVVVVCDNHYHYCDCDQSVTAVVVGVVVNKQLLSVGVGLKL